MLMIQEVTIVVVCVDMCSVLRMTPDYPSTVWHKYQIHR
jgi:hypothetical protein